MMKIANSISAAGRAVMAMINGASDYPEMGRTGLPHQPSRRIQRTPDQVEALKVSAQLKRDIKNRKRRANAITAATFYHHETKTYWLQRGMPLAEVLHLHDHVHPTFLAYGGAPHD